MECFYSKHEMSACCHFNTALLLDTHCFVKRLRFIETFSGLDFMSVKQQLDCLKVKVTQFCPQFTFSVLKKHY